MKGPILPLVFGLLLILPAMLFADIVYQGRLVQSWPSEAMPKKFDNHRGAKILMGRATLNAAEAELSNL